MPKNNKLLDLKGLKQIRKKFKKKKNFLVQSGFCYTPY